MEKDYNEILLQAMDTVIAQRLSELAFDKTIICTITDSSERDKGIYKVTDGSIVFEAYSENTNYSQDDKVYVNIPSGDWTQQKQITGRYITDLDNEPITLVKPLEKIAELTNSLIFDSSQTGLIANGDDNETLIVELDNIVYDTTIYDTIAIRADFQCWLDNYAMRSGRYGLRIRYDQFDENKNQIGGGDLFLDSAQDMFGNPYAYISPMPQEQAYKFPSSVGTINKISIYFYQSGNFTYLNDYGESSTLEKSAAPNIWVSNVEVFLGADVSQVKDKTVKIYTNNSNKYNPSNLTKNINLIWYNKGEGNKFIGFDDGSFNKDFAMNADLIPEDDTKNYYWIEWYATNKTGANQLVPNSEEKKSIKLSCVPEITMTEVYAIVWLNGNKYLSETLVFHNETDIKHLTLGEDITFSIVNDANAQDAYPIYGEDNLAMNGMANILRTVKLEPKWKFGNVPDGFWDDYLKGATITWTVSNNASMLKVDNPSITYIIDDTTSLSEASKFSYRLSEVYYDNYINNTITCNIKLSKDQGEFSFSVSKSLSFSSQGVSGTNYTLVVRPKNNRRFGFEEFETSSPFEAILYDIDGKEIINTNNNVGLFKAFKYPSGQSILLKDIQSPKEEDITFFNAVSVETEAIWAGKTTRLISLTPIVYSKKGEYYAQAPTKIIYDSFGKLRMKNLPELKLFDSTGKEVECVWSLVYRGSQNAIVPVTKLSAYPLVELDGNKLKISPFYDKNFDAYPVLSAQKEGKVVYSQPLIIEQFKYESEILNEWDGSLSIDEEDNRIMANAAVFGTKSSDNTFSGVVLGSLSNINNTALTRTGILGYHKGAQSYGFFDDGTAYLGKAGGGRISFDGEQGIIASQAWIENNIILDKLPAGKTGSKWDLAKGHFFLQGGENSQFTFNGEELIIKTKSANIIIEDKKLDQFVKTEIKTDTKGLTTTVTNLASSIYNFFVNPYTEWTSSVHRVGHYAIEDLNFFEHPDLESETVMLTLEINVTAGPKITRIQAVWNNGNGPAVNNWYDVTPGKRQTLKCTVELPKKIYTTNGEVILDGRGNQGIIAIYQGLSASEGGWHDGEFSPETTTTTVHWAKINRDPAPAIGYAESQFKQTADQISAKVSDTVSGSECSWKLKPDRFEIYAGQIDKNQTVLWVDKKGLHVDGDGKFTGILRVQNNSDPYGWEFDPAKGINMTKGGTPVFKIDNDGLWMNGKGTFTGALEVSSLKIGQDVAANAGIATELFVNGQITAAAIRTDQIQPGPLSDNITIAGWKVSGHSLIGDSAYGKISLYTEYPENTASNNYSVKVGNSGLKNNWRILAGTADAYNFGVDSSGHLYAEGADISGTIAASKGKIGKWEINEEGLTYEQGTNSKDYVKVSDISNGIMLQEYNIRSSELVIDYFGVHLHTDITKTSNRFPVATADKNAYTYFLSESELYEYYKVPIGSEGQTISIPWAKLASILNEQKE